MMFMGKILFISFSRTFQENISLFYYKAHKKILGNSFVFSLKFQHVPLYLEWAPVEVFKSASTTTSTASTKSEAETEQSVDKEQSSKEKSKDNDDSDSSDDEDDDDAEPGSTLFVKNLNFESVEDDIKQVCGHWI